MWTMLIISLPYLLAYAINCEYTRGVMLSELNLQNLAIVAIYLIGYLKSCGYQLYCSIFTSLVYFTDG